MYVVDMYWHLGRIASIETPFLTNGVEAIILFILCTDPWVSVIASTARTGKLLSVNASGRAPKAGYGLRVLV